MVWVGEKSGESSEDEGSEEELWRPGRQYLYFSVRSCYTYTHTLFFLTHYLSLL